MHLFEGVLHNNSQILENVPESEEGEADKEAKGAADVRDQRDDVIGDHLVLDFHCTPPKLNALTSFLTETETEAYFRATP